MSTDETDRPDAVTESPAGLFLAQLPRLKRIAAGLGLHRADAEDVLQDVYVQASRKPRPFDDTGAAVRWLTRVTINRCLLEFQRRKRWRRAVMRLLDRRQTGATLGSGVDADARCSEERALVRRALQDLDETLFAPLVLRYFCDLDATEIGAILELPPPTVRGRLRDARLILADRLSKLGLKP